MGYWVKCRSTGLRNFASAVGRVDLIPMVAVSLIRVRGESCFVDINQLVIALDAYWAVRDPLHLILSPTSQTSCTKLDQSTFRDDKFSGPLVIKQGWSCNWATVHEDAVLVLLVEQASIKKSIFLTFLSGFVLQMSPFQVCSLIYGNVMVLLHSH